MHPSTSVFIATSLDGFISRLDGSIDWLIEANRAVPEGEDCGYRAFFDTVDVLVMGRHTFDQVLTFDPWPYGGRKVVVLTSRPLGPVLPPGVSSSAEPPDALLRRLAAEGARHVYIDGGETIRSFLAGGLIDRITTTVIPILLGSGRPLFGALPAEQWLSLVSSKAYPFGFVQSTYRVQRAAPAAA